MLAAKTLPLEFEPGVPLRYSEGLIAPACEELLELLDGEDYMRSLSFAKKMMMSQEIKSNNTIEGINDDLSVIDEVIKTKSSIPPDECKRIVNLYHGYQYILTHKTIDKEHLKELYEILSDGLLDEYAKENMGEFYRQRDVYIMKGRRLTEMFNGADADKIDYYMNQFFAFINNSSKGNDLDAFITSQIMHFYFVHIHPFFDINGRTSRTVAMWYLLNNNEYPYIIFNQAIAFAKKEYEKAIICGRSTGDISLFLKFMISHVEVELEKEHVIHSIKENSTEPLDKEELQLINYILTMKGEKTAKELATFYNSYNHPRKPKIFFTEKVAPLIEKGVILNKGNTKGYIADGIPNMRLGLNPDLVSVNPNKVKHLSLERCF